jgi:hypothetical protein
MKRQRNNQPGLFDATAAETSDWLRWRVTHD